MSTSVLLQRGKKGKGLDQHSGKNSATGRAEEEASVVLDKKNPARTHFPRKKKEDGWRKKRVDVL